MVVVEVVAAHQTAPRVEFPQELEFLLPPRVLLVMALASAWAFLVWEFLAAVAAPLVEALRELEFLVLPQASPRVLELVWVI